MKLKLSPDELERVHRAKDILIQDLKADITIIELSWQVGLDEKKLKAGFKQEFGKAIKTYLRLHKIEKAKELLEAGKSLVYIANTIGYKNITALVKAFGKEVGEPPMNWRKKQQRKNSNHGYSV